MTIQTAALNGINVEDLGLNLAGLSGWADIPKRTFGTATLPLIVGQRALSASAQVDPRVFQFRLLSTLASATARSTALDALVAQFHGLVEVTVADHPTRVCYGLLTAAPVTPVWDPFLGYDVTADCTVTCFDPFWYDRDPVLTNIAANTTVALPMGTGTIRRMQIVVFGSATNPVVILTDQMGDEVQRMTLTGSLGSTDYLTIDCDLYTITKSDGTDLLGADWLGKTEDFFNLRPTGPYSLSCALAAMRVSTVRSYWT